MAKLLLYTRQGCQLCSELLAELRPLCANRPVEIQLIDVDSDETLRRRYGFDVPVLTDGDEELCRHRLDREAVEGWLKNREAASYGLRATSKKT